MDSKLSLSLFLPGAKVASVLSPPLTTRGKHEVKENTQASAGFKF